MPKFVVSGSNDQFFIPDDSHYYFDQMQGPTYMRIVPNAEHSMTLHYRTLLKSITAFMVAVKENWELPTLSWKRYENASHAIIDFKTNQVPTEIKAWKARSLIRGSCTEYEVEC
ncbi:autocrine proliferation repressor protein A-like [Amphiura filiformis]|uniref:autocrine proliferation repressor protein A-like n=1 Tax=Amphiura filiformis TaxID=82378 RepID=UPI003B21EF80